MDFCRITQPGDPDKGTPDISTVIFTTHHAGSDDTTPLQMVSAEQIAYWKQVEANYLALLAKLAVPAEAAPPPG